VELLVNGRVVATSLSFPWNLSAVAPAAGGAGVMEVRARVTDGAGNVTSSHPVSLYLAQEVTAPTVVATSPAQNGSLTE
jgi:hypothetical protein